MTYAMAKELARKLDFTYDDSLGVTCEIGSDKCFLIGTYGIKVRGILTVLPEFTAGIIYAFALSHPEALIGGWLDKETGTYYLDKLDYRGELSEALAVGRDWEQKAIFDLFTGATIPVVYDHQVAA